MVFKYPIISTWVHPTHPELKSLVILGIYCPSNAMPWYRWLDISGWWWVMFRYAYFPSSLVVSDDDN